MFCVKNGVVSGLTGKEFIEYRELLVRREVLKRLRQQIDNIRATKEQIAAARSAQAELPAVSARIAELERK